jgi:peptide deformylase
MGHPLLQSAAEPVVDPHAGTIRSLIDDMVDTMGHAGGIGLAAPQVRAGLRIILFHVPAARVDGKSPGDNSEVVPLTVLINPEFVPLGSEQMNAWEACLAIPGLTGMVFRWHHIGYRGLSPEGRMIEREATGLHARVVQHECDHLDGVLYPQRMPDLAYLGFLEEMRQFSSATTANPPQAKGER